MTFEEFVSVAQAAIERGEIQLRKDLTKLDFAVMYAAGREMEESGDPELAVTADDMIGLIRKHCGEAVFISLADEE